MHIDPLPNLMNLVNCLTLANWINLVKFVERGNSQFCSHKIFLVLVTSRRDICKSIKAVIF